MSNSYFLIDRGQMWGHRSTVFGKESPSLFRIDSESGKIINVGSLKSCAIAFAGMTNFSIFADEDFYGCPVMFIDYQGDKRATMLYNSPSLWRHDNTVRLKQAYNDTIYSVSESGIRPYMYFHLGKRHVDGVLPFTKEDAAWKITIDYILESDTYLYFAFGLDGFRCGFYNKQTGQLAIAKGRQLFDKETGQPVQIRTVTPDGTFVALLNVDKCNETTVERLKLNDEDNPIVVMMR